MPFFYSFLFILFSVGWLGVGCNPQTASHDALTKYSMQEEFHSLTMDQVNDYISKTNTLILTDVYSNRSITLKYGVVQDAFNSMTGIKNSGRSRNASKSLTPLGAFSIHLIDFCPPWLGGRTRESSLPCSDENLMGTYALWFKGAHNFGLHGRPTNSHWQPLFKSISAPQRDRSQGCVVAPQENLVKLINLVLSDPKFKDHPGVLEINKYRNQYGDHITKKNVNIRLVDSHNDKGPEVEGLLGNPITYDLKILTIDTGDSQSWPLSFREYVKQNAVLRYFESDQISYDPEHHHPERLVKKCTVHKTTLIYDDNNNPIQELPMNSTIVIGPYKNHIKTALKKADEQLKIYVATKSDDHRGWSRWISNLSHLKCEDNYHWTTMTNAQLLEL